MKEVAHLLKLQFTQSPELEIPQQQVISSHGSEVTNKTDRCSWPEHLLMLQGGHPSLSRHPAV